VAVMARPFTTISVAAECRFCGRAAEEVWGAGAVDATGAEVGAPGSGAGTVSAELGGDVAGAATGGVGAAGSSATGDGAAGGAVGRVSTDWDGVTSGQTSACASAALDDNAANASATKAVSARIDGRSGCSARRCPAALRHPFATSAPGWPRATAPVGLTRAWYVCAGSLFARSVPAILFGPPPKLQPC
jgi:hypothetical protein